MKIKEKVEQRSTKIPSLDPSFSLRELLAQVTYGPESKFPLPQNTREEKVSPVPPLITQLPVLTINNKLELRNVHLRFTQ